MEPVRLGDQDGAIIRVDHRAARDPVLVHAVSGLDVDLIALGQLREVDPVDVVGGDANHPWITRPRRRRIVTRAPVEHTGVDPFFDRGEIAKFRDPDGEIDPIHGLLQARVHLGLCRLRVVHLTRPLLVEPLLLGHPVQHPACVSADEQTANHNRHQPHDPDGVDATAAAAGIRGGARQRSAHCHLLVRTPSLWRLTMYSKT
jgi:hypothetical protein